MLKKQKEKILPIEDVFPLWQGLTTDERQFVRSNYSVHHFKKNEMIHAEGSLPTHMMILVSGKAKVYKDGVGGRSQIIRMLKPGDTFGYRAIIAGDNYSTNVKAFEPAIVYMFKAELFLSVLRHNNAFCYYYLEDLAKDLADSDARTVNLTQKHIRGRWQRPSSS